MQFSSRKLVPTTPSRGKCIKSQASDHFSSYFQLASSPLLIHPRLDRLELQEIIIIIRVFTGKILFLFAII